MANRRHVSIFACIAMTTLILTQFQNCGPANIAAAPATEPGGEMRTIDDWNKTEIQFVANEVQIHDEAIEAGVEGLCNRRHNGAQLRWAVYADKRSATPMLAGQASCASGQFNVQMAGLENLVCGVKHLLVVEGDWGGSTYTNLLHRCQPLASELLSGEAGLPGGTECSLEYQVASDEGSSCNQVCYRANKVVMNRAMPAAQCAGIAAKLAGP